ncbi:MAG: GTP 3',8-cyclase MoaA [Candidatus Omnitrophica bacterium]|nr:GTP 3',8-cyclase MoaA [Candidatus Omnitrophota bacterium]
MTRISSPQHSPRSKSEQHNPHRIVDQWQRPLRDLRISVTDQCNFRCPYCMPKCHEGRFDFVSVRDRLSYFELIRLVHIFTRIGIKKVRLTGGEPLLRPNLTAFIRAVARIPQIKDIALTTNGSFLNEYADDLKASGLSRLTISLDTLDQTHFTRITSQNATSLEHIIRGIQSAEKAGFRSIKINAVVQKNVNDQDVLGLVRYFRNTNHVLRFIEFMDVGRLNSWTESSVVKNLSILEHIHRIYPLVPLDPHYKGEVARRYRFVDGSGEIGFISAVSDPFCEDCHRVRLSSEGFMFPCLYAAKYLDLRALLRSGQSDHDILKQIILFWQNRDDQYSLIRQDVGHRSEFKKREMYQIGG